MCALNENLILVIRLFVLMLKLELKKVPDQCVCILQTPKNKVTFVHSIQSTSWCSG